MFTGRIELRDCTYILVSFCQNVIKMEAPKKITGQSNSNILLLGVTWNTHPIHGVVVGS